MSKQRSVYKATYGRLDEMNRSQRSRDMSFGRAQSLYDDMEPNYADYDEENVYARAAEEAVEHAEQEAQEEGYPNIDALAMQHYGITSTVSPNGQAYSPGEQLIDRYIDMFEEMIRNGEI